MKILILENEIYLAQSILAKLTELGHHCDSYSSIKEPFRATAYDVILLSTNINQDLHPIIEAHKESVIILMVSYISNDTVSKPLKLGAKDYIQKPFMIEDLIRKIEHFQDYERLKRLSATYERYLDYTFRTVAIDTAQVLTPLPLFISSAHQKQCDAFAFKYASIHKKSLHFITLQSPDALHQIATIAPSSMLYITDFQQLKKSDYPAFFGLIANRQAIIASTEKIHQINYRVIELKSHNHLFDQSDIMPIEEYVKYILIHYQQKLPDTELSKKLGISRKSLWEKRKKYGIFKKK